MSPRICLALCLVVAAGCNDQAASPLPESFQAQDDQRAAQFDDQTVLGKVYATQISVPAGFALEPPALTGQSYTLRHLRSKDIEPWNSLTFELCSDDMNQALGWSDSANAGAAQAAVTTVEERDTLFQITRQDTTNVTFHRVFKCSYLNRDGVDPMASSGPAGILELGDEPALDLRKLTEYLWQFSPYSNPGAAVLASRGSVEAEGWSHTLYLARRIAGGGQTQGCDRIERIDWRHTVNSDGILTTLHERVRHFEARQTSAGPEICRPAG